MELRVSDNCVGDDGMLLISSELQYNNVQVELWAEWCGLSVKGTNNSVCMVTIVCVCVCVCARAHVSTMIVILWVALCYLTSHFLLPAVMITIQVQFVLVRCLW